ncbi:MAG: alpha/beta hydrolase [Chloroflexota bacterium]
MIFFVVVGCGGAAPDAREVVTIIRTPTPNPDGDEGVAALVDVYFATDRQPFSGNLVRFQEQDGIISEDEIFGGNRNLNDELMYGSLTITIPKSHSIGEIEEPVTKFNPGFEDGRFKIFRLEELDKGEHILLETGQIYSEDEFFSVISDYFGPEGDTKAFIFVHGFNVSFSDAAKRTAQLTYDLNFEGIPVFYSWPAVGGAENYVTDLENIEWTEDHLEKFLVDFANRSNMDKIYIIAHSMGTRGFTNAYIDVLERHPDLSDRFEEIILAAPDIDRGVFRNRIAPQMVAADAPVTIYASSNDNALRASGAIRDENDRVGYISSGSDAVFVYSGIETIDISSADIFLDLDLLNHSAYGDRREVMVDLNQIIREGIRADERFGLRIRTDYQVPYWVLED